MANKLGPILRKFTTKVGTVESNEVDHFKKMADAWWSLNGGAKALHGMNPLRISVIRERLEAQGVIPKHSTETPLKGLSLLDVGCGAGILTESLHRMGCKTTGLDATPELIQTAKYHADSQNLSNIDYVCLSIEEYAAQHKNEYNIVVASEVLEHVTQKEHFLKGIVDSLQPGGSIFITTFNKYWYTALYNIYMLEYVFRSIPVGTHQYSKFILLEDTLALLKKLNCKTVYTTGMMYNPIANNWYRTKNNLFSYIIHAVKCK